MRKHSVLTGEQADALDLDDSAALALTVPTASRKEWEWMLLESAARGKVACFRSLIDSTADALRVTTGDGQTLQHFAARFGQVEILHELISRSVDVNARQDHGLTPLMFAAAMGHREAVEILLNAGANPSLESARGVTAHRFATDNGRVTVAQLLERVAKA